MSARALILGGTKGIGFAVATQYAELHPGANIIVSGRTKPEHIPTNANIEYRPLDATSMREIKQYTDRLKAANEPKLDLLVMTNGILSTAGRTETPEGIDRKMALHYYSKQLLVRELLPVLKDDAIVIIVLDSLRGSPEDLNWDDLSLKKPGNFTLGNAAKHCMAMNDAMIQMFAAEQAGAMRHFSHANPRLMREAGVARSLPFYMRLPMRGLARLMGTPSETYARALINGTANVAAKARAEGRFWSYTDHTVAEYPNKAIWTEENMQRTREHTWGVVDSAIKSSSTGI